MTPPLEDNMIWFTILEVAIAIVFVAALIVAIVRDRRK